MAFTDEEKRDYAGAALLTALAGMDYDAFKTFIQGLSQSIQDEMDAYFDDQIDNHTDRIDEMNDLKEDVFAA